MGTTATVAVNVPKGIFSWGIGVVFVVVVSVVAVVQTRFRRNLTEEKMSMCPKMHVHRPPLLGLKSRLSVRSDSCVTDSASEIFFIFFKSITKAIKVINWASGFSRYF